MYYLCREYAAVLRKHQPVREAFVLSALSALSVLSVLFFAAFLRTSSVRVYRESDG